MLQQNDLELINRNDIEYSVFIEFNKKSRVKNASKRFEWKIRVKVGNKKPELLLTKRGEVRIFKSFDTVLSFLLDNCQKATNITLKAGETQDKEMSIKINLT